MTVPSIELLQALGTALRNVYGAGGGDVPHSAAYVALSQLLWQMHNQEGLRWGQNAYNFGGSGSDVEESFKRGFADSLGWSDAEFNEFWNDPNYRFTPEDAERFDQNYDDFIRLTETLRR